jgi:L-rhamnose-H+ transport protein
MTLIMAFVFVLIAGLFQGSFVLPMTMTTQWRWEHTWATFSLFGMLLLNWMLALIFIPEIITLYTMIATGDILILALFGAGWGTGAILFGLGMEKLGMALGYPIIMGLIASLGSIIPLAILFPQTLLEFKGLILLLGTGLTIYGILLCAQAGARKQKSGTETSATSKGDLRTGVVIAVFAGILSCLPNVGMAFGGNVIAAAIQLGVSESFAGNAVWALFFTVGFIVNFGYCVFLMITRKTAKDYFNTSAAKNIGMGLIMAVLWIGSFYLYGMSAAQLGTWGVVVGWPLFISLSIIIGNLWGVWRGEWKDADPRARKRLNRGLIVLIVAVVITSISNIL